MVDTINNGTTVPPFNAGQSKAPSNKNEAFYVAATNGSEDPISEYDKILEYSFFEPTAPGLSNAE